MMNKQIPEFSIDKDMRGIYRGLYSCFPNGFPEIFVFKNLPGSNRIMKNLFPDGRKVIFVKDGNDESCIELIKSEIENPSCYCADCNQIPITYHSLSDRDVSKRLVYACYVADVLDISLKQICFTHGESMDGYSEEFLTFIGDKSIWDALVSIAHELRHAWQHKYHSDWMTDYIHPEENEESYYNQMAEIDAEAFGIKIVSMITGIELINYDYGNLTDPVYKTKLIRRLKDIDIILTQKKIKEIRKIIELDRMLTSIGR